jgi:putative transposase
MSERQFRRTPGGGCSLGLHLVWCLKCRRQILGGGVAARCGARLGQIAGEHGWQIVAKDVIPDHLHAHLFVRIGPADATTAAVVRAFKDRTARVLPQEVTHLRRFAKVLWSPPYFAAAVGDVSESRVRRYIEHQCDAVVS